MSEPGNPGGGWRLRLQALVETPRFQRTIIVLILVNAVVLGLETSPGAMAQVGCWLIAIDRIILAVFVAEIAMRLAAYGARRFFRDPWSVFDFLVVAIALVPASETFSVIRALRVLRVLRLLSVVPRTRAVVAGMLKAIPGLTSIIALLGILFYVAAVMATNLFGEDFPEWFGSLGASLYSLFQVMTLESWSMGIARPVMEVYPYAWAFFVPFILVATFTVLNLFIAVVVNAMQGAQHESEAHTDAVITAATHEEAERLRGEIVRLREEIADLRRDKGLGPALGPGAAGRLARLAAEMGLSLTLARSDWRLGRGESAVQRSLTEGWAAAALEQAGSAATGGQALTAAIARWHDQRRTDIAAGRSRVRVGHHDALLLPR